MKKPRRRKPALMDREDFASLSPEEQEKKIIEMIDAHVPMNDIVHVASRGVRTIMGIRDKHNESLKPRSRSLASQAFKLFKEGKNVLDVAIELGIEAPEAEEYFTQYWRLLNSGDLYALHKQLGPELGEFITTFKHLSSRGITVDQAIEIRNLSSNASELRTEVNTLSFQKSGLSKDVDQLKNQVQAWNSELNKVMPMVEQLRQEHDNLNAILNSIKQGDIRYQRIDQIAKVAAKSVMATREEQIFACLTAIIMTLKNDPQLVALLIAPGPGLSHPDLREKLYKMIDDTWNEMSNSVEKQTLKLLIDGVRSIIRNRWSHEA